MAHRLRARLDSASSQVVSVLVPPEGSPEPVELVLGSREEVEISILARDADGEPASGALVFLEESSGQRNVSSADAEGCVRFILELPLPERIRFAVFAGGWSFHPWQTYEEDRREPFVLLQKPTGSLTLTTEHGRVMPDISSPEGWDVDWLLMRSGIWPEVLPQRPLHVGRLPPGSYFVAFEDRQWSVSVEETRQSILELE